MNPTSLLTVEAFIELFTDIFCTEGLLISINGGGGGFSGCCGDCICFNFSSFFSIELKFVTIDEEFIKLLKSSSSISISLLYLQFKIVVIYSELFQLNYLR